MADKRQDKRKANFIMQGGAMGMAGFFTGCVLLGKQIPLTGLWGDFGNGVYAAVYESFFLLWMLTAYGLSFALATLLSSRYRQEQYRNAGQVWKAALLLAAVLGTASGLLLFFGAGFIAEYVLLEPLCVIPLKVLSVCCFLFAMNSAFRGYFQGGGTYVPTAISMVVEQLVFLAVCFPAATLLERYGQKVGALLQNEGFGASFGVIGASIAMGCGSFLSLLFLFFVYRLSRPHHKSRENRDGTRNRETLTKSLGLLVPAMAAPALCACIYRGSLFADQLLYRLLAAENGTGSQAGVEWGIYYGKYKVWTLLPVLYAVAMGNSLIPSLRALQRRDAYGQIRDRIFLIVKGTMLAVIPAAAFTGALSACLLELFYGPTAAKDAAFLSVGCLSTVFYALAVLFAQALQGLRKQRQLLLWGTLAFLLHMGALYVFLEQLGLGLYGLAYADVLLAFLLCFFNGFSLRKCLRWNPLSVRNLLPCLLAGGISGLILFLLARAVLGALVTVLLCGAAGLILYPFLLLLLKGAGRRELVHLPFGGLLIRLGRALRVFPEE